MSKFEDAKKPLRFMTIVFTITILVVFGFKLWMGRADMQTARPVIMYPATTPVDLELQETVRSILTRDADNRNVYKYAITNVSGSVVSVIGLPDGLENGSYKIQDAVWMATVDTKNFIDPVAELPPMGVDNYFAIGGSGNILPFQTGTTATYGTLGVHDCGYSLTGWKAVDLILQQNEVFASQSGDVSFVCRDSTSVAVRVGDLLYSHLADTGQQVGIGYDQGQSMGSLVTGNFDDTCGWARQGPTTSHIHFCFIPNPISGSFTADGYVLNTTTQLWLKSESTVAPGGSLRASWVDAGGDPVGKERGMFNIFDKLLSGFIDINNWVITTLLLPPGTNESQVMAAIDWGRFFGDGALTVIELTGAALSTFNWSIILICITVDLALMSYQLIISIAAFISKLVKTILIFFG